MLTTRLETADQWMKKHPKWTTDDTCVSFAHWVVENV